MNDMARAAGVDSSKSNQCWKRQNWFECRVLLLYGHITLRRLLPTRLRVRRTQTGGIKLSPRGCSVRIVSQQYEDRYRRLGDGGLPWKSIQL